MSTYVKPARSKIFDRLLPAGLLSFARVLAAGVVLATGLVGCVGEQSVSEQSGGEPSDEAITTSTEQIDEASTTVAATSAPVNAIAPARDKFAPSLPQLDLLPATEGAPAGTPEDPKAGDPKAADPKAADPKAAQSNSDRGGSDRMDPEPCPWTQKGPPS